MASEPLKLRGTLALLLVMGGVFAADLIYDGAITTYGARSYLVWSGAYHRLILPTFLHVGFLHFLFNGYALLVYGPVVETMIGTRRFLALYVSTGALGFLASLLGSPDGFSVGASASIFGLLGFVLHARLRYLALRWSNLDRELLWVLGVGFLLVFIADGIDHAAHIGGFVAGLVCCSLVRPSVAVLYNPATSTEGMQRNDDGDDLGEDPGHVDARDPSHEANHGGPVRGTSFGASRGASRGPSRGERTLAALCLVMFAVAALFPLGTATALGRIVPGGEESLRARYAWYFLPYWPVAAELAWRYADADDDRASFVPSGSQIVVEPDRRMALAVYWRWLRGASGGNEPQLTYTIAWRLNGEYLRRSEHIVEHADPDDGYIWLRSSGPPRRGSEAVGVWEVEARAEDGTLLAWLTLEIVLQAEDNENGRSSPTWE